MNCGRRDFWPATPASTDQPHRVKKKVYLLVYGLIILDNHSAHISKETRAWLASQPAHRFEFTFTPKHGSWLNLVEGFFSKLARSVLRHIRVASKQELKNRLIAAIDYFNRDPVVHTWTYKLDKAA
jgi:transposase